MSNTSTMLYRTPLQSSANLHETSTSLDTHHLRKAPQIFNTSIYLDVCYLVWTSSDHQHMSSIPWCTTAQILNVHLIYVPQYTSPLESSSDLQYTSDICTGCVSPGGALLRSPGSIQYIYHATHHYWGAPPVCKTCLWYTSSTSHRQKAAPRLVEASWQPFPLVVSLPRNPCNDSTHVFMPSHTTSMIAAKGTEEEGPWGRSHRKCRSWKTRRHWGLQMLEASGWFQGKTRQKQPNSDNAK